MNTPEKNAISLSSYILITLKMRNNITFNRKNDIAHDVGPYDYGSIMHYGEISTAFAINPTENTLTAPKFVGQRKALSNIDIATITEVYSLRHERLFSVFHKKDKPEIQVYKWKLTDLRAKYDELWPQNWRLRELNPYVVHNEVRYNAVWYKSNRRVNEIQIYGWKPADFRAKYNQLWPQDWRLHILRVYVIRGRIRYSDVWRKSTRSEIQVYQWKEKDFLAKI